MRASGGAPAAADASNPVSGDVNRRRCPVCSDLACAQLLLDEVMEREELRLARKAHLLEHGTDGPSETLKGLL